MSTSPENPAENIVTKETIPLITKEKNKGTPFTIQTPPSKDSGSSTTNTGAPCAKYGNEEDPASSSMKKTQRAKRKLIIACILCVLFLIAELVGRSYNI
jgi:hypothetical protein